MNTTVVACYHCGADCDEVIRSGEKHFCCEGCKQVYLLLDENNLCNYYDLDTKPGITMKGKFAKERFAYLDAEAVVKKLVRYSADAQMNVSFQLPQIHCSSCIYLLEHLHRIDAGIISSRANFQQKNIFIVYDPTLTSLSNIVATLAFVGYEPAISLADSTSTKTNTFNKKQVYAIGIAGFCFANIMMLSFPEYFSGGHLGQAALKTVFTWLIFFLSLPVLFYSARVFFVSARKGLQQHFLNIDVPIVFAIIVTFARSYYEIISGKGAGYLDSGTGIIFFMLAGRWFQNKTYESFLFDRDYRSYFPLGVTIIQDGIEKNISSATLKKGDNVIIRNEEMIPADAVLLKGNANIDNSFINGESATHKKNIGDLIYAGAKQCGTAIILEIVQPVSQSYITQLWNNAVFAAKKNTDKSFIHPWSKYFTLLLFAVAAATVVYWSIYDVHKIIPAFTAVLIIACPCSLLLSATFTYGNMLRIFGRNKLFLKNASVIASIASIDNIVFDKTGTLTLKSDTVSYTGRPLCENELLAIKHIVSQSAHPLSKAIAGYLKDVPLADIEITGFKEYSGKGLQALAGGNMIKMGSAAFISEESDFIVCEEGSFVHLLINSIYVGKFAVGNLYREEIKPMVKELKRQHFGLHVLSGDNNAEQANLSAIFGVDTHIHFYQSPQQKLEYVKKLQQQKGNVLMIGDGLNDAGALMQSNVGIAVSDNAAQFSPACDAILDGDNVKLLSSFIGFAKSGKKIITTCFIISIVYNIIGLSFAVQGTLLPVIAAILMPVSSVSIVLLCTLLSFIAAKNKGLYQA